MNENKSNSATTLEELKPEKPKRCSRLWRVGRVCLLAGVTLVTLFFLFHLEENWRGKRAWQNYKTTMQEQGAIFELEKLVPPAVPEDQNFAMTPLLKPLLDRNPPGTTNSSLWRDPEGRKRVDSIDLEDPKLNAEIKYGSDSGENATAEVSLPGKPNWRLGERVSLPEWQSYYRQSKAFPSWPEPRSPAEDVLKALSRYDSELSELLEASKRPYARFDINWSEENPADIELVHLSALRRISRVVQLRALAKLEMGNTQAAFDDVQLLFTLADSVKEEPTLISHLVRLALLHLVEQTLWEGLSDHRWSETQLAAFQKRLIRMDLIAELQRAMMSERAFGTEIIELMIQNPRVLLELSQGESTGPETGALHLIPTGWMCMEAVNLNRVYDDYILKALPEDSGSLSLDRVKRASDELEQVIAADTPFLAFLKHRILMKMLLPALGKVPVKSIQAQAMKNLAVTAIALESYALANQALPESLDSLVPQWLEELPRDPATQEPFHYQRAEDGAFRLWSVGWNEQDDGGVIVVRSSETGTPIETEGDWVWPQAHRTKTRIHQD